jgi:hypothetical protein
LAIRVGDRVGRVPDELGSLSSSVIFLPNSAHLQNIGGFIRRCDFDWFG